MIFKLTVYYLLKWIQFLVEKNNQKKTTRKQQENTGKMEIILEKSGNFVSPEKLEPCRIQYFSTFAEEGRYGAQTTHVTYATQSAHTYQQTAQPQSAAYAREPAASNSSKYGTTAPSQSAFSSYPSHYAAHQQKTITEAHYPAGYRVPAQAGQHGKLLSSQPCPLPISPQISIKWS